MKAADLIRMYRVRCIRDDVTIETYYWSGSYIYTIAHTSAARQSVGLKRGGFFKADATIDEALRVLAAPYDYLEVTPIDMVYGILEYYDGNSYDVFP